MKNKYVVLGMIIIIVTTAILGVYEVLNSVAFKDDWKATKGRYKNTNDIINNTIENKYMQEMKDFFYKQEKR